MSNSRNIHADDQLRFAAQYFIYHVRMYVETLIWLQTHERPEGWDTIRNAVLETHLVHERVLVNFICNATAKDTDVIAIDYFHDSPNVFLPLEDEFLKSQAKSIGGQLVHLTIKAMPKLKSEQEWSIRDVATKLVPAIKVFLNNVKENRFTKEIRIECLEYLSKLYPPDIPVSINSST